MKLKLVGSVVKCFKRRDCDRNSLGSKPILMSFYCVLGKDTLRHFPCLVALASSSKFQLYLY